MLFNSLEYIFLFLPVAFTGYFLLHRLRLSRIAGPWLVGCSLFFYSYWNPVYLPLIVASVAVNFLMGRMLLVTFSSSSNHKRRAILVIGIVFNLGLLFYFKYVDFFIGNLNLLIEDTIPLSNVVLPLAISFFTFQQVAYLADAYARKVREYGFMDYSLFVTFFPQLIAGPIVHHREMMPQFARIRNYVPDWSNISAGLFIFSLGLFKKVVIADGFALWANAGFGTESALGLFESWATSLAYTFQLYYDFSGYSDMAIGAALLFNIRLPVNFNSPYRAVNIQDFWQRWHITLSRWLRDYVFIPLGGSRRGRFLTYNNLFVTFLLGGLWHGAAWTFVVWGALHGLATAMHRVWTTFGFSMSRPLGWALTFLFANFTWVFFRAESFDQALRILSGMVGRFGVETSAGDLIVLKQLQDWPYDQWQALTDAALLPLDLAFYCAVFGLLAFLAPSSVRLISFAGPRTALAFRAGAAHALWSALMIGAVLISYLGDARPGEFLYFRF
jgi:alginate O-acetyltransferase complex protein AlgI